MLTGDENIVALRLENERWFIKFLVGAGSILHAQFYESVYKGFDNFVNRETFSGNFEISFESLLMDVKYQNIVNDVK